MLVSNNNNVCATAERVLICSSKERSHMALERWHMVLGVQKSSAGGRVPTGCGFACSWRLAYQKGRRRHAMMALLEACDGLGSRCVVCACVWVCVFADGAAWGLR